MATPTLSVPTVSRAVTPAPAPQALFDRHSLGFVAMGVLFALRNVSAPATLGVGVAFEVLQGPLQQMVPGLFPPAKRETAGGKVADVASIMAGWALIKAFAPGPPTPPATSR